MADGPLGDGLGVAGAAGRTTATGHPPWCSSAWLTEPSNSRRTHHAPAIHNHQLRLLRLLDERAGRTVAGDEPLDGDVGHLPTIEILPSSTDPANTDSADRADGALADSIDRRRIERRRMSHRPVPTRHLAALGEQAARLGAGLVPVTDPAVTAAAHDQNDTPGYEADRHRGGEGDRLVTRDLALGCLH